MIDTKDFLLRVVTGESGNFCLAFGNNGTGWKEEWFNWPQDIDKIVARAEELEEHTNVYFSTYLFSDRTRIKECVLPTRTITADLDEADINSLPVQPNVLVQTSPGRHQAFWVLDKELDLEIHEILSRKLTYSIPRCDRSGWPLGRTARLPNTWNYKYLDGRKPITVMSVSAKEVDPEKLELLPDVPHHVDDLADAEFIESPEPVEIGPFELLNTIKDKIPHTVFLQYDKLQSDRSAALWALLCAAFRAGLGRAEVFHLARNSANNKFAGLKYHADRELAKDVLRAESVIQAGKTDTRALIAQARKLTGSTSEKRRYIQELVQEHMQNEGQFFHTVDDSLFYIRSDVGRPISLTTRSEYLWTLLDMEFGLNPTESEHTYVINGIVNWARTLPVNARLASVSHYDEDSGIVLIHGGRAQVFEVTKYGTRTLTDGAHNVIFPWHPTNEPFRLDPRELPNGEDWSEVLFGSTIDNVLGVSREEARVLLKVWFLFTLLRSAAVSRPILALFGQPGAGKSTTFRRIYTLLYGKYRGLSSVTNADDFDHAVASDPLVVLDNVDTWERWLPDRLAASISNIDIVKRKLFTDSDIVVLKRQAMIAITAHNPQFGREDVTDRLLLLNLKRLEHFQPEADIIERIDRLRSVLWYAITQDLQTILNASQPSKDEIPQMRVEDFARIGYWIAKALGVGEQFTSVVNKVRISQKMFSVEEEQMLVDAIAKMVEHDNEETVWRSAGQLWTILSDHCTQDTLGFQKKYKSPVALGKKLWSLQDALKEAFVVEFKFDSVKQAKTWMFRSK